MLKDLIKNYKEERLHNLKSRMICPRCKSNNISITPVAEKKSGGVGAIIIGILLAYFTFGLSLLLTLVGIISIIRTNTTTYCVCKECGKKWTIK